MHIIIYVCISFEKRFFGVLVFVEDLWMLSIYHFNVIYYMHF